ncbi:RagB/SusD family nutrient uptake outer membrane protein [Larkinella soli]|uniref:RagB/SusD family nutrient uptake outer membrane protein n=1 Tax=Larkinella soli TaxID=1770527 RepID=UPI000FFBD92C|nr:RagB/SusD family nutrient uptake outer membrane protein [Larkinella soli]
MKLHKYPVSLLLTLALLAGCSDDTLNKVSPNALTVETFWKTSDDAVQGVNATYSGLQQIGVQRWPLFLFDLRSDEGYSQSPWTELANMTKFITPNSNFEPMYVQWTDLYRAIGRANQVIAYVPDIEMDATLKTRVLSEAKFLRAIFYYYLVMNWGNVPMVLTPQTPNDRPDQATEAQVWAQIEKDLTEAKAGLPVSYDAANVGRATKGAATALLGKVLLQQRKWADAAVQLKEVVDQSPTVYDLVPNYQDNFTATNENNKESVFEVQYASANRGPFDELGGSEGSERAQFFGAPGIGWTDGQPTRWLFNEFMKEKTKDNKVDPRLDVTMWYYRPNDPNYLIYGKTIEERQKLSNGRYTENDRFWRKYQNDYPNQTENYFSPINYRMIRFADVLLMYAEALNETGKTAEAIPLANRVRARVNMPNLPAGMSQAAFREQLRHDRVVELAGESVRFADLKRYGLLGPELAGPASQQNQPPSEANFDTDFKNFVKGKSELLPIPQRELDANPKLKQNPGW